MSDQKEFRGKTFRKKDDIVNRSIAGEAILVPIKGRLADMQRIFTLNPVADFIWKSCDGTKRVSDICDEILNNFEVDREQADSDIREFLGELLKEELITEV